MYWQYVPYVLPLLIAAAISAALALFAWRRRPAPGAAPFALLMLAVTEWSLGYALELGSADLPAKVLWAKIQYLGIVTLPVMWLVFALQYTGRERWLTCRNLALWAIVPLITLLLVWTNDIHGLIWRNIRLDTGGSFSVLDLSHGTVFWGYATFSYLLLLLGTFLLLQALIRSPYLYRGQAGALLIGALTPWLGNALYLSGLSPFPHLDLTPFAFTLTGLAISWGLFRFRLLNVVPVARDVIIENMGDAVLVLDAQNRIVDLNPAAQRIIGRTAAEAIGQPAARILSSHSDLIAPCRDVTERHAEITLGEGEAQRTYDLRISPLYGRRGRFAGRVVTLRDITERKRAEEQLCTRERFLECLAEVSQILLGTEALAQALPQVLHCLGETAEVSRVYLFENHLSPGGELLCSQRYEWCAPGVEPQIDNPALQNFPWIASGFARWVEVLGQGGVIAGAIAGFPESERAVLGSQDIRSILVIPLFVSDAWYGFIGFDACDRVREWRPVEVDLLQVAASDIASSIEREQARRREQALAEAAAALTATLDFEQVLDRILEQVGRVVPSDAANIMFIDGDRARIVRWRGYERFGVKEPAAVGVFRIAETPTLRGMLENGEPIIISDTATYPDWVRVSEVWDWLRSYAAAPIVVRGEVVGFLNVDSATPGFFTQVHLAPLCAFADYAAAAIENARLFDSLTQERNRLELLYGLSRTLSESLRLEEVTDRALRQTCAAVGAFKGVLLLLEPGTDRLHLVAASGYEAESVEALDRQIGLRVGRGLAGWVAAERRTALVADVLQDEHWLTVDGLDDWVRSALVVPLLVHDRLVGVLSLYSEHFDAFDEAQRQLVEAAAVPVAIAIQNAQLYHQVARRAREQELLNRISAGLGAALNADTTINCALEGLQELVGADRTYFVTADLEARTWETTHELVAPGIEPDIGLSGTFDDVPVELETLLAGDPFAVSDIASDPRVEATREMYRSLDMQSMLLVPVQVGKRLYGALGFDYCHQKHIWQPDEIRLLEGVAHQLELALENVRLFKEAQLRAEELTAALARLEELDRLRDQFIQNVSHELRSPLALIRGYAEVLGTGELGELQPEQQKSVAIIARRARMLGDLVDNIMFILEAEASPPRPEPVLLDELTRAAVEDFQVVVRQAELTLRTEIAPHLPPVSGSPDYLRRVLDNLLSNAVKFTPAGGTITVRVRQEREQVALEVSDTGIGIPADRLGRIFERFYQVDGSARRRYGGVGLGLALVKELVEAYDGRVTVESQVGQGTTFTVLLPIAADTGVRGE